MSKPAEYLLWHNPKCELENQHELFGLYYFGVVPYHNRRVGMCYNCVKAMNAKNVAQYVLVGGKWQRTDAKQ